MTTPADPLSTLEALIAARHERERRERMRAAGFVDSDLYEQWFILERIRQEQLAAETGDVSAGEGLDRFGELGHRVSELLDAVVVVLVDRLGSGAPSEGLCSVCGCHGGGVVPGHDSPQVGVSTVAPVVDGEPILGDAVGASPSSAPTAPHRSGSACAPECGQCAVALHARDRFIAARDRFIAGGES